MEQILYASAMGNLMYTYICTRPDIAFIGTNDHMLVYRKSDNLEIFGYIDSDFAGCQDSRRSTSDYMFILTERAISWKSVKQTLIATSTMAAEYIACYEASNQALWLWNFVVGLHIMTRIKRPLRLLCDRSFAIQFSNNNRSLSKSKHIDIKYLVVNERTQNGHVSLEHIGTDSMITDHLTKGLPPMVFRKHTSMGILSLDDVLF
ncbi:unnamed protein product [Victoria cruziana]